MSLMNPTTAESREMGLRHKIASLQTENERLTKDLALLGPLQKLDGGIERSIYLNECPSCHHRWPKLE